MLAVIIIDQCVKIYVKTHFLLGEAFPIFSWFQILFVENEGAAWGLKLPGDFGKLALTVFRIVAVAMIFVWMQRIMYKRPKFFTLSVALIFSGAVGNIIDSLFYGMIFNESNVEAATLFSREPYGKFLYGRVVDMISFPIIDTVWPSWVPFFGGKPLEFFKYVFNISDASITLGGIGLFFAFQNENKKRKAEAKAAASRIPEEWL